MKKFLSFLTCLVIGTSVFGQGFYDLGTIQTIEITFSQSNWDQILDTEAAGAEGYTMAQTVSLNGTVFDSVGVKFKGNSTYNPNQAKNPFHIELDTYKDQDYQGYKDIKLSNVAKDPSFLREVLSYQILRQYMDAPLSNYANVYVNGSLIGLYSNSEAITKTFLDSHFYSKKNAFVKCNPPAGAGPGSSSYPNLVHLGPDSTNYYAAYELKSDYGWQDLIDLCDTLGNTQNHIEKILDVDRALWMLTFDNVLVNLDSYIGGFAQNYYLYRDDYGRFIPIVWDLNESFGRFSMTGTINLNGTTAKQQMTHVLHENDAAWPLVKELLADPTYRRMYLAHFKTMLEENFSNNSYFTNGQTYQTLITASVQADNNKFFTYNNFIDNLTTDIGGGGGPGQGATPGITNLMNGRVNYLLGLNDFSATAPSITNVSASNATPLLNDTVFITADISNLNAAFLGYRTELGAPFTKATMFDDGMHNDGAAGDGNYGGEMIMSNSFIQYYLYAENNTIGKFSPVRAEYEFYTLEAVAPPVSDLVINELMASNSTTEADQDGEFDDWIELYNNTNASIDLSGYYLSDDAGDLMEWTFPMGTSIGANGYLIIWADNDTAQAGLHANFKLSSSGETLYMSNTAGTVVDQVTFTSQMTDTAYGRYPNGTGAFQTITPTFNRQNTLNGSVSNANLVDVELIAYPNPTNGTLSLKLLGDAKPYDVVVYDISGKVMHSGKMTQTLQLDVSNWSNGIYFARVGTKVLKVVKAD